MSKFRHEIKVGISFFEYIELKSKADPTSFYSNSEYETAQKTFIKVVPLRAKSVLAQINDEKASVDANGINLSDMGGQEGMQDKRKSGVKVDMIR